MIQEENQTRLSPMIAALELDSGVVVAGQVVSFEGDSIELSFARAEAPLLGIAQLVVLRLRPMTSSKEVSIPVRVVARSDDGKQRKYELQPRRKDDLARLKRTERGEHMRVRPRADAPLTVELRDQFGKRLASGNAIDVSVKGLGMVLEATDELTLTAHEQLILVIQPPGDPRPRIVSGFIRSRRLIGVSIRIGILFEPERTPEFREAEQWLTRYVMLRMDEMATVERKLNSAA